jgi:DNA-binding response OmpR family regulator
MWILIIDDDNEDSAFLEEALKELVPGCRCCVATTCEKGLKKLTEQNEKPTHVFLDGMLYGMSSKDCLKILRNDSRSREAEIIIYSGFATPQLQKDFLKTGADLFLSKPSSRTELLNVLTKILLKD